MYRYLETNLGVMSLSKDEMERVRQAQRLYHVEGKSTEEIAAALHLSDEATARLVGYNTHFLSVFDLQGSEEGDPFERLLPDRQGASAEQIVYRKVSLELLEQLFQTSAPGIAPSWGIPSASMAMKNCPLTNWGCGSCSLLTV